MPKKRLSHNSFLPKLWQFTHGAYYYRVSKKHSLILGCKRILLGKNIAEAHAAAAKVIYCISNKISWNKHSEELANKFVSKRAPIKNEISEAGIPMRFLRELRSGAKKRALRRGMEFNLTVDDMRAIAIRSNGKCELTGISWDFNSIVRDGMKRPWIPSLDRKDSRLGYSLDNCRLVCWAVNVALSDWGEPVFLKLVSARKLLAYGTQNSIGTQKLVGTIGKT